MKKAASGSAARLSQKEISSLPIEDTCIPILWRMSWSRAPMSLCAQAGKARGGYAGVASRSISWPLSKAPKRRRSRPPHLDRAQKAAPLALRLVAFRKPPEAAEASRAKARRAAQREGNVILGGTLAAAEWVILVTSLDANAFSINAIGELYRARWRIEMAFKRLKSLIGLSGPPGEDPEVAKTWILAHLLMILLLGPHASAPDLPAWLRNRASALAADVSRRQGPACCDHARPQCRGFPHPPL